jgi:endogenous inhibitor of DNA gyrase (YacG/DUF329 family)
MALTTRAVSAKRKVAKEHGVGTGELGVEGQRNALAFLAPSIGLEVLMFCPNCGQQQVSESTKFCSRCGALISGLAEWLAGGAVPVAKEADPRALPARRLKGVKRGVQVMFVSGVLAPVFFGLCFLVDNPGPLLIPLSIFLAGLAMMLYTQLFAEGASATPTPPAQPPRLGPPLASAGLPPAAHLGINNLGATQGRTKELVQPPSITEHTTRLLDSD